MRLDDQQRSRPTLPGLTFLSFASPTRLFWKWGSVLEKTDVVTVPPGHWRPQAVGATSTCLGGPAFDGGPGEAVFAGYCNAAAVPLCRLPDMVFSAKTEPRRRRPRRAAEARALDQRRNLPMRRDAAGGRLCAGTSERALRPRLCRRLARQSAGALSAHLRHRRGVTKNLPLGRIFSGRRVWGVQLPGVPAKPSAANSRAIGGGSRPASASITT